MTGALRGMHTGLGGAEGHRQTLPLQPETQREGSRETAGQGAGGTGLAGRSGVFLGGGEPTVWGCVTGRGRWGAQG